MKAEWPGILAWAIEGCMQWQQLGLCPPTIVTEATNSYLESQDILGEWLNECCVRDANAWTSSTDLFESWRDWAAQRDEWVGSVKTLSEKLEDRRRVYEAPEPGKDVDGLLWVAAEGGGSQCGIALMCPPSDGAEPDAQTEQA